METKFQTSFIPKRPLTPTSGVGASIGVPRKVKTSINIFFDIALFIFIISIGAGGAVYAWKSISKSQQVSYQQTLSEKEKQFKSDLIEELKTANVKIDTAKKLISNHIAMSRIFEAISTFTVVNIRFLELEMSSAADISKLMTISMKGQGANLPAVAFQADVLGSLTPYGLNKVFKNPIISDPILDENGVVTFGFKASIDPSSLVYKSQ